MTTQPALFGKPLPTLPGMTPGVIAVNGRGRGSTTLQCGDDARAAVSAYFAALPSPRPGTLIETVEELGQLHESTYVEDMHGDRGVVFNEHIWYPETKPLLLNYALKHYGPFTVLWVPTEGGGQ